MQVTVPLLVGTLVGLFAVLMSLNNHRLAIKRGPQCATCPLYEEACKGTRQVINYDKTSEIDPIDVAFIREREV